MKILFGVFDYMFLHLESQTWERACLENCMLTVSLQGMFEIPPSLSPQARDMKPQDDTDIRPILVTVGQLLAPTDFQMVLEADNTSQSTDFNSLPSVLP